MPLKRKILLYFLVPFFLLCATEIVILSYLRVNEISNARGNALWYCAILFGVAASALLFFAVYASNRISGPVLKNARLTHRMVFPERVDDEWDKRSGFDEIFRMEVELKELSSRLNAVPQGEKKDFFSIIERFFVILEGMMEGVVLLDAGFGVVYSNGPAKKIIGVPESSSGEISFEDIHASGDERDNGPDARNGNGESVLSLNRDIDHNNRIFQPRLTSFSGEDGKIEGYVIVFWDVTEERQYEESRRRFISTLSHQLKTPMTSLTMAVSLLKEKLRGHSPATDELVGMAKTDCDSLSSLITELIGASRDTTATLSLSFRRDDVTSVLSSALRPFHPRAEQNKIDLKYEYDCPIFAKIDPVKFSWVVANIVANALRCTDAGGGISVHVKVVDEDAVISVSDTGPGISKENVKKLFTPFVSFDENPKPDSMGLGLVIAKEIVEAHEGTIDVESEPGKGTTFIIKLPLA